MGRLWERFDRWRHETPEREADWVVPGISQRAKISFPPSDGNAQMIHCNPEVLHAPGRCVFCDHYGHERQAARLASRTPFTPDEANGWMGNVAQGES